MRMFLVARKKRHSQRLVDKYLPLDIPVDDHIVLVNRHSVFAMFELRGYAWQTQSPEDIARQFWSLNGFLHNIANETITLHFYKCKGEAGDSVYPSGRFPSAFAESLDIAYRDNLFRHSMYAVSLYLGIEISPPSITGIAITDKIVGSNESRDELPEARITRLKALCAQVQFSLAAYRPRLLGVRDDIFGEIPETLAYAMTGYWRPIGLTTGRIGQSMLSEDVWCGWETLTFRSPGPTWYGAMFGMRRYLSKTWPGILDRLLAAPFRFTLYQSFKFVPTQRAQEEMRRRHAHMIHGKSTAASQATALAEAADHLGSANWVMGDHCLSLLVFADDSTSLFNTTTAAWAIFSGCGAVVARENLALEGAWASLCPGNHHHRPRPAYLPSTNMACLESFHAYPTGDEKGYWGDPIAILRTISGEAYRFHLHVDDVGNVFITGRIGSGKSTLIAFLVAQAGRLGAQVILWDKDRGLKILVEHLDGIYFELKNPTEIAPLRALQPIQADIDFLHMLITNCILSDGIGRLTAEESRLLYKGIVATLAMPPEKRGLWNVRCFLGTSTSGAGARLEKWCWGHERGWVIDNPSDKMRFDAPVVGFDKTFILDDPLACAPVMAVLYYYSDKLGDGRRLLFVDDEFSKSLENPVFAPMIANQIKARSRKGNSPTILATQDPRDVLRSDLAHTIKAGCPTKIAFAPGDAAFEDFGPEGLGYTRSEYEIIRSLPSGTGEFLLRQGAEGSKVSVRAQLPLSGMDDEIAVMSGRPSRVKLFDRISAEFRARWRTEAAA